MPKVIDTFKKTCAISIKKILKAKQMITNVLQIKKTGNLEV